MLGADDADLTGLHQRHTQKARGPFVVVTTQQKTKKAIGTRTMARRRGPSKPG